MKTIEMHAEVVRCLGEYETILKYYEEGKRCISLTKDTFDLFPHYIVNFYMIKGEDLICYESHKFNSHILANKMFSLSI